MINETDLSYVEAPMVAHEQYVAKEAGFWIRFFAFIFDNLVITALIGLLVNPVFYLLGLSFDSSAWYAPITVLSAIVYYGYFVGMTFVFQQTLGKMVFGLRVIKLDETKPTLLDILFREWIGRFISNFILLLYVFVAILPKHQGLHDYFAETYVIHEGVYTKQ
ncbi:MAG TPA: RDD family protein [Metalysinibacillus jejuensis]|uniref:RDD family protein n=1 Tax=Metalysinibacillus jejuensis TaxID=914327 RepID=A0A921NAL8_9BACL|nr:RDD family protein [Metalysinibacillus jejuensis]HJH10576.1 RDD family protein [Metalysinibacillus jejuensis]